MFVLDLITVDSVKIDVPLLGESYLWEMNCVCITVWATWHFQFRLWKPRHKLHSVITASAPLFSYIF